MLTQEAIFIATIKGTSLKSKLDHSPRNCVWCQMNGRVHPAQQFLNSYPRIAAQLDTCSLPPMVKRAPLPAGSAKKAESKLRRFAGADQPKSNDFSRCWATAKNGSACTSKVRAASPHPPTGRPHHGGSRTPSEAPPPGPRFRWSRADSHCLAFLVLGPASR